MQGHYNVLFVCNGNSARSLLAEAVTNHFGQGRFHGYSAGSQPKGFIYPQTLEVLRAVDLPTETLRSKGWEEFTRPGAPVMDFVITVCDQVAGEVCPAWPGDPITAHWSIPDPAKATGEPDVIYKAFLLARNLLQQCISLLMNLRMEALDRLALTSQLAATGQVAAPSNPG
ncbi:transcriptional regulator, ArsR family [Dyella jiangningensis]|uniref:arsenate reductase ArsC n=1 Tax=Dyella sp. AtDHG13 TaxID=1938897 RepID=UPI00088E0EBC|nr:arsenate reductase ArsC [Dyella sp. AtDHG13]PXV54623.1 arsenate reductase [Dyella sp. AtDHG13]SDK90706.1 transcriptional regulator, ArsR family [Dyella jiangningensis]